MKKSLLAIALILALATPASASYVSHSHMHSEIHNNESNIASNTAAAQSNSAALENINPDRFKFNLTTESRLLPPSWRNSKADVAAGYTFNMLEVKDTAQHMAYIKLYLDPYSFFKSKE